MVFIIGASSLFGNLDTIPYKTRKLGVGENTSKEQDRKSELVHGSTYQIFEWDRNNSDQNFDFRETNRIAADRIF